MLIHHDDCGLQKITEAGFRDELQQASGVTPSFAIESFTDVEADVRQSILRVRRSDFLPYRDSVRGFVYDVDTHALREVAVDDAGGSEGAATAGGDPDRVAVVANPPGEEVV
jgi:carbonic anhydrase